MATSSSIPDKYRTPEFIRAVNRAYHDLEADVYQEGHPEILRLERARWRRLLKKAMPRKAQRPPRVLDLGCGTGFVTLRILEARPDAEIIAADLSPAMLQAARAAVAAGAPGADVRFELGAAEELSIPAASLHLVTMNSVLHHIPEPDALLRLIHGWLRPGGFLAIGHEPNAAYYTEEGPRAIAARLRRLRHGWAIYGDPRRYASKISRMLGLSQEVYRPYRESISAQVVERLREEGHLAPEEPFDRGWVGPLTDVHVPLREDARGGLAGLDLRALASEQWELIAYETYNPLADEGHATPLHRALARWVSRRHPDAGAHAAILLRKKR